VALLDLKTDLSKLKRDSFTSDIENKSKGIASRLNLDFGSFQPIEDKFKEGVPQPNLDFGGSLDKPTPTVPTSIPGTPDKLTQPPRSFDATLDKPVPTVLTTMEGTIVKSIPIIDSNWTVFQNIVDKTSKYSTLGIANWFPDTHATGFTLRAGNLGTMYRGPSSVYGKLGFVNYFSDIHATGFTGDRLYGDVRFPEGSEYIGIGSYNNPGRLWFGTTPKGQLHQYWSHGQSAIDYKDWTRKPFPIFSAPPGISSNNPNPQYDTRDKLYSATEAYTNDRGSYYSYFKRNESELDIGGRGTLASAWDHGSVKLSIDDTGVPTIETNQYTKYSKTRLFNDSFTSFPDIPSKMDAYPPSMLIFPRGGPVLTVKRGLKDIERHAKWLITGKGIVHIATQVGLQLLNTRPETRIWNPLALGSIIPTIHIKRQLAIPLMVNTQDFGPNAGMLREVPVGDPVKIPGAVGTSFGEGPGSYTGAQDFIDVEHPTHTAITGNRGSQRTKMSRLVSHVSAFFSPLKDKLDQKIVLGLRKSIGQSLYLVPGGKGIFGHDISRDVHSQHHLSSAGRRGKPIHESTGNEVAQGIPSLGKYKTLTYGELKRLDPSSTGSLGTPSQFSGQHYERIESTGKLEYRYKFGSPGMPGKDRTNPLDGVNAKKGDKLDTIDLLNAQGYISKGNVKGGTSFIADGKKLPLTEIKPTTEDYPDLIPLHFYDVNNKAWILFRAYIGKFNDTVTPSWSSTDIAGRPVPQYYYQKTERKISFDFKVAAMSKHELAPMWQKLNYLVGLCYPSFTNSVYPTMINPFIKLTLGDVFHHVPGFLTTLTVSPIENISWELIRDPKRGLARVPMGMNVSLDFTYVGDSMPSQTSPNHYLHATYDDWIDHTGTFWGTKVQKISYPADIRKTDK